MRAVVRAGGIDSGLDFPAGCVTISSVLRRLVRPLEHARHVRLVAGDNLTPGGARISSLYADETNCSFIVPCHLSSKFLREKQRIRNTYRIAARPTRPREAV